MNYFTKSYRMDTLLVTFLLLGLVIVLILSIAGSFPTHEKLLTSNGCGTQDLSSRITSLLKTKERFIAVVGDGVPGESLVVDRPYNTQFAQGYDLYQGVHHALGLPALQKLLEVVGILFIDDGGNPSCARQISEILAAEPRLLGVIGHSSTSSTREALPAYSRSNVPVIIPAATNPDLLQRNAKNCFRLPSNDSIQSLVIADLIITKFKAKTVFVVWDATPEAMQYSKYLKTNIQHHLSTAELSGTVPSRTPIIEGSYPISLNPLNYSYLFRRIVSSDADVVVFAGYGSLAREFLLGLDSEYSQYSGRVRPKIILTDGCKIPGISGYGFDTYITFAAAPVSTFDQFKTFDRGAPIGRFQKMYLEESFEVFGYDAAVIFLTAIRVLLDRDQGISREQIIRFISNENKVAPTCYPYAFEAGDNVKHRYYCYSISSNTIGYKYDEDAVNSLLRQVGTP